MLGKLGILLREKKLMLIHLASNCSLLEEKEKRCKGVKRCKSTGVVCFRNRVYLVRGNSTGLL